MGHMLRAGRTNHFGKRGIIIDMDQVPGRGGFGIVVLEFEK